MSKENHMACEDRIEVDQELGEMSVEALQALKNIIEMCHDCGGCEAMLAAVKKELENRKK